MSLMGKMLRIAGRGEDGKAKAISTTNEGILKTQVTGSREEQAKAIIENVNYQEVEANSGEVELFACDSFFHMDYLSIATDNYIGKFRIYVRTTINGYEEYIRWTLIRGEANQGTHAPVYIVGTSPSGTWDVLAHDMENNAFKHRFHVLPFSFAEGMKITFENETSEICHASLGVVGKKYV